MEKQHSTTLTKEFLEILPDETPVTIITVGANPVSIVSTWSHTVFVENDHTLLIPAGWMHSIENDFNSGHQELTLTFGSYKLIGTVGEGRGYYVYGTGEFQTSGPLFDKMSEQFDWIRAVLVVHVQEIDQKI